MKSASKFEKVAARCWNLLNEGKPFTPIFVVGTMLSISHGGFNRLGFGFSLISIVFICDPIVSPLLSF